jgi:hypothetical protein
MVTSRDSRMRREMEAFFMGIPYFVSMSTLKHHEKEIILSVTSTDKNIFK